MATPKEENLQIAKIIAAQITNQTLFMIGATKNLRSVERGLSINIKCRGSKFNYLTVTLNSMDTYDMHFQKIRGFKVINECKLSDIYADQLREIIANKTGLAVSL